MPAFDRDALGLPQELFSEEWKWAEFNCGNVTLALHGGVERPENIAGGRVALAVEDVHAACTELKSKGARMVGEPVDYGVCCAVEILGPDGNTVVCPAVRTARLARSPSSKNPMTKIEQIRKRRQQAHRQLLAISLRPTWCS